MNRDQESNREILIIRRGRGNEEDGHHGGVWKIAYADFMTAMMAFFLVMWLINATNEETKAGVASYFNPVKMVDRQSTPKGIQEIDDVDRPSIEMTPAKVSKDYKSEHEPLAEVEERQLFDNPYAILAEIAEEAGVLQNRSKAGEGGSASAGPSTGADGGDAYRDPFNPNYWSTRTDDELFPLTETPVAPPPLKPAGQEAKDAPSKIETAQLAHPEPANKPKIEPVQNTSAPTPAEQAPSAEQISDAKALAEEIARATGTDVDSKSPDITVVPESDGVLIQLTDRISYGMFSIGSAKPDKRLVLALEEIAKILAARTGGVIISGHTDARPFKGETYDNWRLSTARAHMAYYMLLRGGLKEERILRVEGHAARDPKVPSDPNAAQNRRIEIFLKKAE